MRKFLKGLGIWDLHYPLQDTILWDNILKEVRSFKPDVLVLGGDNMNMTAVDHWLHDKGLVRKLEGRRVQDEYEGFTKDIMKPLERILKSDCHKIWLDGNHENWIELAIDKNPQGEGYWEIENNLHLKAKGWEVVPYGKFAKVGKLYLIHGQYTNIYHARKTVDVYEKSIMYGHDHTYQVFTKSTPVGNEAHSGIAVPCACGLNPDYQGNKPSAWVNGFVEFFIQTNGNFNVYPIVAINGHFTTPNGQYR
jgi:hypothetical protein